MVRLYKKISEITQPKPIIIIDVKCNDNNWNSDDLKLFNKLLAQLMEKEGDICVNSHYKTDEDLKNPIIEIIFRYNSIIIGQDHANTENFILMGYSTSDGSSSDSS